MRLTPEEFDDLVGVIREDINSHPLIVALVIGDREEGLTKDAAKLTADYWLALKAKMPEAVLMVTVHGFDDDPRELWEITSAQQYIRRWAHLAGFNRYSRATLPDPDIEQASCTNETHSLFAICGAYGEALRNKLIANYRKHHPH